MSYIRHINVVGEGVNITRKMNNFYLPNSEFHSVNNEKFSAPSLVERYTAPAMKTYLSMYIWGGVRGGALG